LVKIYTNLFAFFFVNTCYNFLSGSTNNQIIFKTPTINWFKNGTQIKNDDSIEIDETYLRFKSLDYKINSGNYSCQFILSNKKMITSSLFEVKIERKSTIINLNKITHSYYNFFLKMNQF
jgi:hypothetical protein